MYMIAEVLEKSPGLGANQLLEDVTPLYCEKKGSVKLSRRHFYKYLGLMKARGLVVQLGGDKKGKKTELHLTDIGKTQYRQYQYSVALDITQKSTDEINISGELKALYAIILYFNHGVNYRVYTEDALENILRQFGLSISYLIRSEESIVESEGADIKQVIFRSPKEDAIVFKDIFLRSDTHERGTMQYRCTLRGITCESILENRDLRAFRYLGFKSDDIRSALESLCDLNILKPVGSLGLTVANEVIYKVDKSLFDFMFALHSLNGYDIFDKIESIMTEIWYKFRPPTETEMSWLYFVYGDKEADRTINNAYESRKEITNGESIKSYISKIRRNDKAKLDEINKKVVEINEQIMRVVDHMKWIQESYKTTVDRHKTLLKNILEIIYPNFFSKMELKTFK